MRHTHTPLPHHVLQTWKRSERTKCDEKTKRPNRIGWAAGSAAGEAQCGPLVHLLDLEGPTHRIFGWVVWLPNIKEVSVASKKCQCLTSAHKLGTRKRKFDLTATSLCSIWLRGERAGQTRPWGSGHLGARPQTSPDPRLTM